MTSLVRPAPLPPKNIHALMEHDAELSRLHGELESASKTHASATLKAVRDAISPVMGNLALEVVARMDVVYGKLSDEWRVRMKGYHSSCESFLSEGARLCSTFHGLLDGAIEVR